MLLTQASRQWASRPDDERYTSLVDMMDHFYDIQDAGRTVDIKGQEITVQGKLKDGAPCLRLKLPNGRVVVPNNWSFGQLCALAKAPANYLRRLPEGLAAQCLNNGLHDREEEVSMLYNVGGGAEEVSLRSINGVNYGRIWNADVTSALVERFGDGVSGDWRVPGEFGKEITVTTDNTTLYASDRDMFVFLANEKNRVTVPNRRGGEPGSLARGFFVWNSEVGAQTLGIGTFLFDYACSNRIVWGAQDYKELRIRHTAAAPDRFLDEVTPLLENYAESSASAVEGSILTAQGTKVRGGATKFLTDRFGKKLAGSLIEVHHLEEDRPIETLWDVVVAGTAYAKRIKHMDSRVELERQCGEILEAVV